MSRDGDRLMTAVKMLTEGNACFSAIRWCPEQHVLSFRRSGDDEWVNLWLHADELDHEVERNGQSGGGADVLLWEDGRWPEDGGSFIFTLPKRLTAADVPEGYRDRVEYRDFRTELP